LFDHVRLKSSYGSPNSWLHVLLVSPSWSSYTPTSEQSWQWFAGGSFCQFIASLLHPVLYHSLLQSGTMMNIWLLSFLLGLLLLLLHTLHPEYKGEVMLFNSSVSFMRWVFFSPF
jgi:hypothetical protein